MARKIWSMDKPQSPRRQRGWRSLGCKLFVNSVLAALSVGLLAIKFLCTTSKIGSAMVMAAREVQPILLKKIILPKPIDLAARIVGYSIMTGIIGTGLVLSVHSFPWILVPVSAGLLLYNQLPSSRSNFKPTARPALLPTALPKRVPRKIRGNTRPSISSSQRKLPAIGKQDVLPPGWNFPERWLEKVEHPDTTMQDLPENWQPPDAWYRKVEDPSTPLSVTELQTHKVTTRIDPTRLGASKMHIREQYIRSSY